MEPEKLVIITGSNKGIGYGLVEILVQKNYKVIMACRNIQLAEEARLQIIKKHSVDPAKLDAMQLDISDSQSIDTFIKTFSDKYQQADILINNAGVVTNGDKLTEEGAIETFKVNFYGTIELSEKIIPYLKPYGKIITIGSTYGKLRKLTSEDLKSRYSKQELSKQELFDLSIEFLEAIKDGTSAQKGYQQSPYGMSKLGINAYAKILARNPVIIAKNIQVYCCCPGSVITDMNKTGAQTIEQGCSTPMMLVELPHEINPELQGQMFSEMKITDL